MTHLSWHDRPKCKAMVVDKESKETRQCQCAAQPDKDFCFTHSPEPKEYVGVLAMRTHPEEGDPCPNRGPECPYGKLVFKQEPCYCAATHAPCSACTDSQLVCNSCGLIPGETFIADS